MGTLECGREVLECGEAGRLFSQSILVHEIVWRDGGKHWPLLFGGEHPPQRLDRRSHLELELVVRGSTVHGGRTTDDIGDNFARPECEGLSLTRSLSSHARFLFLITLL